MSKATLPIAGYLRGNELVKLVISEDTSLGENHDAAATTHNFFIHKGLLESLSPKLHALVNPVSKTKAKILRISGVDVPTVERFIDWAYTKDYNDGLRHELEVREVDRDNDDDDDDDDDDGGDDDDDDRDDYRPSPKLLIHAQMYKLGHMYDIDALAAKASTNITSTLKALATQFLGTSERELDDNIPLVLDAVNYCFKNLPLKGLKTVEAEDNDNDDDNDNDNAELPHASNSKKPGTTLGRDVVNGHPLNILIQYIAWSLDSYKWHPKFTELLSNVRFTKALVYHCLANMHPPWQNPHKADVGLVYTWDDTNMILLRTCKACNSLGTATIQCKLCKKYDSQVGTSMKISRATMLTVGEGRIDGGTYRFNYTCRWCNEKEEYRGLGEEYLSCTACRKGDSLEVIEYLTVNYRSKHNFAPDEYH